MMAFEKDDGLPATGLKARVDALSFGGDVVEQRLVALNLGATGSADLNEGEAALVRGVKLEEELDAAEALENAFGVIDTIDANSQECGADAELVTQRGTFFSHGARRLHGMTVFLKRDADGIRPHASDVSLAIHGKAIPFGERLNGAIAGGKKIVAISLALKSHPASPYHALYPVAPPP